MKIDIIWTFDSQPQQTGNYPFDIAALRSKRVFIDFLTAVLSREERGNLVKISTCIETALAWPITNNAAKDKKHWFNKCRGKIWVDDLERWRKSKGIASTVSPEMIKDFMEYNYPKQTA